MSSNPRTGSAMPDVPKVDFIGALCEIWFGLYNAAYHLAYVRVYLQTKSMQADPNHLRMQEQEIRNKTQVDLVICRAHLAAFFRQLDHIFEALQIAVKRAQSEQPTERYFWSYEKQLEKLNENPIRQEISAYRNTGHEFPAVIGCAWGEGG